MRITVTWLGMELDLTLGPANVSEEASDLTFDHETGSTAMSAGFIQPDPAFRDHGDWVEQ